mgnify:CR=1 FL=1|tara:strand:+ start:556 stop:765 length:210 start_codon:yes stop_codon:yes gene_type:complete
MAMIARGYLKLDSFEFGENGEKIRNWTYVDDIVSGTIAAAEKIHDGTSINLGTINVSASRIVPSRSSIL